MKTRFMTILAMFMLVELLALSCAPRTTVSTTMSPNPFYESSWWGTDPVCSPGCPAGIPHRW